VHQNAKIALFGRGVREKKGQHLPRRCEPKKEKGGRGEDLRSDLANRTATCSRKKKEGKEKAEQFFWKQRGEDVCRTPAALLFLPSKRKGEGNDLRQMLRKIKKRGRTRRPKPDS